MSGKRTELAMKLADDQIRKFMAPLPGMVYQCEADSHGELRLPFVCEKFERFFGISAATLRHSAQPLLDRVHVQDRPRIKAGIEQSRQQHQPFEAEIRISSANDDLRWIRAVAMPERLPSSTLWHGYLMDVTDHITTERAVAAKDAWTRAILQNIDDAIFSIDQQGTVQSVNRSAENLFGYSAESLKGKNISIIMPEPYRSRHDGYLRRYLDTGKTAVMGLSREFQAQRSDGSLFPIELQVTQITMHQCPYFIGVVRDITQRKCSESKIQQLAYYDPLTDLPNRRLLIERTEQALTGNNHLAMFSLDMDDFRDLNDSLGHFMGDDYLKQVALRLQTKACAKTTMAHLGGDDFAVLMTGLSTDSEEAVLEAEHFAHELRQALAKPFQLPTHEYSANFSVGIALNHEHADTVEALIKQADIALHQAKKSGKNTVRTFSLAMQQEVELRVQLESEIRRALQDKQFVLHYQPQVQANGSATSVEALVRWQHPVNGLILPGKFVPLCEETGLILELGQWVLEAACKQLAAWSLDDSTAHLRVAVNISMKQFHEDDFVARVLAALDRTGAPVQQLELEMTESLFVQDMDAAIEKMNTLQAYGVRFSLDDFGTGYSSLAYLKRLPLNQLKIDKGFVQNLGDDENDLEIARMIVALADTMNLDVIAEGVETLRQFELLAGIGCLRYQGFLFARPIPAEQVAKNCLQTGFLRDL